MNDSRSSLRVDSTTKGDAVPLILGIHGIAQQYESGPQLTRTWFDALRGGLEAANCRAKADGLSEGDVRVAYFGTLFRPKGAKAGGEPPYTAEHVKPGPERDLLGTLYEEAVAHDSSLGPPRGAKGSGRVAVQVMLAGLLRSPTFAGVAQRGFIGNLKQVTAFLTDPALKERVLQRVADEVTPDTTVLVGHSLGSVVAYEYLARFAPDQIRLLVTLGSPLGIPNLIFEKLTPRPSDGVGAWPGRVGAWVNVADADDVVALRKQLAPLFPPADGSVDVRDHLVDNGDKPHAITRYLNAQPTGEALAAAL
jgi:pimeloyl-ACP methyl ester carboxylesterase